MTKKEFVEENKKIFIELLKYYGSGMIRNKINKFVPIIANKARKELSYSKGTKTVWIANNLYQVYLRSIEIENPRINKVSLQEKLKFISKHIMYFEVLYDSVKESVYMMHNSNYIGKIALLAREQLGYSQKTAPIDIVCVLHKLYIKNYR